MAESSTTTPTAALLAPWLRYARRVMFSVLDELATPKHLAEDLWISWRFEELPDGPDEWIFRLEAMELLDLYVRVDYRAAWAWILEVLGMPLYVGLLDELPSPIYPKHTIEWTELRAAKPSEVSSVEPAFVYAIPKDLHSPQFQDVRAAMMARWGRARRNPTERVRMCLELTLETLNENNPNGASRAFRELEDLIALAEDPTRHNLLSDFDGLGITSSAVVPSFHDDRVATQLTDVFHLQSVEISTGDEHLTDAMLTSLRAIGQRGIQISLLSIQRGVRLRDLISLPVTIDFLRSLVIPAAASATAAVSIDTEMDTALFEAISSALSVTQSVREVRLGMPNVPDRYWSWIAYAFLSGDVSNEIDLVHLRVENFSMEDAEQVERVLRARDPLAALAPSTDMAIVDALQRDRTVIDVHPNTTGLLGDRPETTAISILIDEHSCTNLRMIDDTFSDTHVCVMFPGAGLCWVCRETIVAQRRLPPFEHVCPHKIELEIGYHTSLPALLVLVRLLGPHVRVLMLFGLNNSFELTDEFLRAVVAACPLLERLELTYVTVPSFAWLTENDDARFTSLRIKHVESQDQQGYERLLAALRDSDRGLGRTLRELALRDYIEDVEPLWPGLLGMLTTNRRLERLLVRPRVDYEAENLDTLTQQLNVHNDELLPGQAKPFPLRNRLALLSIFARRPDLRQLDDPILTKIFTFAAPNKRRVCGVVRL